MRRATASGMPYVAISLTDLLFGLPPSVLEFWLARPSVTMARQHRAPVRTVAYIRTSTETNKHRGGKARAARAIAAAAGNTKIDMVVHDIVSGCASMDKRSTLTDLLSKKAHKGLKTIFVESSRDLARNVIVGEQLVDLSKRSGVRIVSACDPGLFDATDTPTQKLSRRMKLVVDEYDRDNVRYKLANGMADKMKTTKERTQKGTPKVAGRKSILEKLPALSAKQITSARQLFKERAAGKFGWRTLAKKLKTTLRLKAMPGHETARRMGQELKNKKIKGKR